MDRTEMAIVGLIVLAVVGILSLAGVAIYLENRDNTRRNDLLSQCLKAGKPAVECAIISGGNCK